MVFSTLQLQYSTVLLFVSCFACLRDISFSRI
jgi:hypothetical protein